MGRPRRLALMCGWAVGLGAVAMSAPAAPGWTVAAWVCADGDLGAAGTHYAATLERTATAQGWALALEVDRGRLGSVRSTVGATGEVARAHQEPANMGSGDALAQFLSWAAKQTGASRRALVIYGHGPGADDPTMLAGDAIVIDDSWRDPLTGAEVAEAVKAVGAELDLIVLDCCHGMRAETLWALRSSAEVVVASSGRAPSDGLPWEALGSAAATSAEELVAAILTAAEKVAGADGGWCAIRPHGLEAVADAVAGVGRALDAQAGDGDAALAGARALCADRGPGRELCDLRELCARLSVVGEGAVAAAARQVVAAIDRCRCARPGGAAGGQAELLVWMPGGLLNNSPTEVNAGEFALVSGWADLVERYSRRHHELFRRTLETPQRGRHTA